MNPLHLSMLTGGGRGRNWRDRAEGRLRVGGRGKVTIATSRANPTQGEASLADFAKVVPGQGGAGEAHPLGTGGTL